MDTDVCKSSFIFTIMEMRDDKIDPTNMAKILSPIIGYSSVSIYHTWKSIKDLGKDDFFYVSIDKSLENTIKEKLNSYQSSSQKRKNFHKYVTDLKYSILNNFGSAYDLTHHSIAFAIYSFLKKENDDFIEKYPPFLKKTDPKKRIHYIFTIVRHSKIDKEIDKKTIDVLSENNKIWIAKLISDLEKNKSNTICPNCLEMKLENLRLKEILNTYLSTKMGSC